MGCDYWSCPPAGGDNYYLDWSAWCEPKYTGRTLGNAGFSYQILKGELELPLATNFRSCLSLSCAYLTSVVFPACTTEIYKVFHSNTSWAYPVLKKIEIKALTPPTVTDLYLPSTTMILVPWSADHSVYTAYTTASGWSTYASQIYEQPGPTQPV